MENGERAKRRMREQNGFSIQARVIRSWRSTNAESAEEAVPHTLNSKPRLLESERQTKRLTSDKGAGPNFLFQFTNFHEPDHGSAIPIDRSFSGSFRFYIRRACVHRSPRGTRFSELRYERLPVRKTRISISRDTRERQKEKGQPAITMANKIYV